MKVHKGLSRTAVKGVHENLDRSEKSLKEHRARALFVAACCDLICGAVGAMTDTALKTACQTLSPLKRSMFLQFRMSMLFCRTRRRSGMQRRQQCY